MQKWSNKDISDCLIDICFDVNTYPFKEWTQQQTKKKLKVWVVMKMPKSF